MRTASAFVLALAASVWVPGTASSQQSATTGSALSSNAPAPHIAPVPASAAAPHLAPVPGPVSSQAAAKSQPTPAAATASAPARSPAPSTARAAAPAPTAAPALKAARAPAEPSPQIAASGRYEAPPTPKCENPRALGVSRTVEIDTTGGPGFGFEHFRQHDFLRNQEVLLTFDDGPWVTTPQVLKALAEECVRATFFPIGKHATYYPEILRQVAAAGHTIGSHTWSHADLSRKTQDEAIEEIEKGVSAVKWALEGQGSAAPFFRFPALRHPPELVSYLGQRNIGIFSTDMDSFDFKMRKPDQVIQSVLTKLKKNGKGIVLLHDFQNATAQAVPQLLAQLKAAGYKIVHMRPRDALVSLAKYDEELRKDQKLPTVSQRPTSSVVRTVD
jgi:peptidoglycan/xylan/chitin deacetylase (PgdA/CDA1 family)